MMPDSLKERTGPEVQAALQFASDNISVCEEPPGSNRGPEIDAWTLEAGSPLGSPWCAISVWKASKAGGLWVPDRDVASCDEWGLQAERAGLLADTPVIGARVLYTNWKRLGPGRYLGRWDLVHIGIVCRDTPRIMSIEGNTTLGKYDREGYLQTLKEVEVKRVWKYVLPLRP